MYKKMCLLSLANCEQGSLFLLFLFCLFFLATHTHLASQGMPRPSSSSPSCYSSPPDKQLLCSLGPSLLIFSLFSLLLWLRLTALKHNRFHWPRHLRRTWPAPKAAKNTYLERLYIYNTCTQYIISIQVTYKYRLVCKMSYHRTFKRSRSASTIFSSSR